MNGGSRKGKERKGKQMEAVDDGAFT